METITRSITKAIVWRLVGSFSTFMISYFFTNQLALSASVGITQLVINSVLYFIHERVWNMISWNRSN